MSVAAETRADVAGAEANDSWQLKGGWSRSVRSSVDSRGRLLSCGGMEKSDEWSPSVCCVSITHRDGLLLGQNRERRRANCKFKAIPSTDSKSLQLLQREISSRKLNLLPRTGWCFTKQDASLRCAAALCTKLKLVVKTKPVDDCKAVVYVGTAVGCLFAYKSR